MNREGKTVTVLIFGMQHDHKLFEDFWDGDKIFNKFKPEDKIHVQNHHHDAP